MVRKILNYLYALYLRVTKYSGKCFSLCMCDGFPEVLSTHKMCSKCPTMIYLGDGLFAEE